MTKKKIIIILIIILVLSLGLWLIFRKPTVKKEEPALLEINFPLKRGSTGVAVEAVQKYLNNKYAAGVKVDGVWGSITDVASLNFLKRDNISKDVFYKWELEKFI